MLAIALSGVSGVGRYPVGRAFEKDLVPASLVLESHAHGVLFRLSGLIVFYEPDEVILPVGRFPVRLVADLVLVEDLRRIGNSPPNKQKVALQPIPSLFLARDTCSVYSPMRRATVTMSSVIRITHAMLMMLPGASMSSMR